ncbi:MAG: hypothetical protein ABI625_17630 [bacterium]
MDLINQLLKDPLTYVLFASFWAAKIYTERRINGGVDARFASKLEEHKQSLGILTETAKFDFQRRLADFNLFAVRKHEAAAKVWEGARIAHGFVTGLYGVQSELTFEEFNRDDMILHLTDLGVPKGKQDEALTNWPADRESKLAQLRPYLGMLRLQEAERKLREAQNIAYLHELYFPDHVVEAMNAFFKELNTWIVNRKHPVVNGSWTPDYKRSELALERLHSVFRDYVSAGSDHIEATPPQHGSTRTVVPVLPPPRSASQ